MIRVLAVCDLARLHKVFLMPAVTSCWRCPLKSLTNDWKGLETVGHEKDEPLNLHFFPDMQSCSYSNCPTIWGETMAYASTPYDPRPHEVQLCWVVIAHASTFKCANKLDFSISSSLSTSTRSKLTSNLYHTLYCNFVWHSCSDQLVFTSHCAEL